MALRAEAPAKINLDLRVLAREEGGYHQIETLFLLVNLCDVVTVSAAPSGIALEVTGAELGATEQNLVHRSAVKFLHKAGVESGVHLQLHKRIPAGAGLGGGSSDAATTLRLLNALFDGPLSRSQLVVMAAELGADVPFFLVEGAFALAWGRGGRMLEISAPEPRHVVMALSGIHISTRESYGALSDAGLDPGAGRMISQGALANWERLAADGVNHFESVAFPAYPVLSEIREALLEEGADFARMSGSGSAIFGIFRTPDRARGAAEKIGETFDCECVSVETRTRWADIVACEG